jgi:hypothetical protein
MICETGANQLVVRCSDCNKIHDPQITRDAIIENPLIPLQPYLTSPRLVSEVCVKGLFYELALAEKQLSAARVIFEGFNPGWIKKLATGQEGYLGDDLQQWHDELKTALTPKQSKITPGQIPLWTTTTTNDDTENNNNSISPKKEKETAADAKT